MATAPDPKPPTSAQGPAAPELPLHRKLKEAISHTLIYGIGSTLQSALGFVLIPLYTRHFAPEDFGVFTLISLCGTLAGGVFFLGASSALSRWYYDHEGIDRKRIVTTALLITLVGAAIQIGLGFACAGILSQTIFGHAGYTTHISLMLVSSAIGFINSLLFQVLRFERRSGLVVVLNLLVVLASAGLIYALLVPYQMGVMAPILGTLLVQAALLGALLIAARPAMAWGIVHGQMGGLLRFGLSSSALGILYYAIEGMDRFVLTYFSALDQVGVYSMAVRIASLIQIVFIMSFAQIWQPMRMQYRNDGNADAMLRLALTYYFMAGLTVVVILSVFAKEILGLIGGHPEYQAGYVLVPWVALAFLFYGTINIVDMGLFVSKKVHWQVVNFILCAVFHLLLLLALVPQFGVNGAVTARVAAFVLIGVATWRLSHHFMPIRYEIGRIGALLALAVGVIVLSLWLEPSVAGLWKLLYLAAFLATVGLLVLHPQERQAGLALIRRFSRAA